MREIAGDDLALGFAGAGIEDYDLTLVVATLSVAVLIGARNETGNGNVVRIERRETSRVSGYHELAGKIELPVKSIDLLIDASADVEIAVQGLLGAWK